MKKVCIVLVSTLVALLSMVAMASAVSFYPLPPPSEKGLPKAERPPSSAVGLYAASWQFESGGVAVTMSGTLATIESSVGKDYVLGAARNSIEGIDLWEIHATRRMGKDLGIQVGEVTAEGATDWQVAGLKSFRSKDAKKPWAADVGLGIYMPDGGDTAGQAFVAGSYDISKGITANLSVWSIAFQDLSVTRTAFGVGYRF